MMVKEGFGYENDIISLIPSPVFFNIFHFESKKYSRCQYNVSVPFKKKPLSYGVPTLLKL